MGRTQLQISRDGGFEIGDQPGAHQRGRRPPRNLARKSSKAGVISIMSLRNQGRSLRDRPGSSMLTPTLLL